MPTFTHTITDPQPAREWAELRRRLELDLLLMEVFGARRLPDDIAERLAAGRPGGAP